MESSTVRAKGSEPALILFAKSLRETSLEPFSTADIFLISAVYFLTEAVLTELRIKRDIMSDIVDDIRKIEPYWGGIFVSSVEETLKLQKGCLISGEGGIGKSYFIKCFEEELKSMNKKHLCLYGKLCPAIEDIDFDEIAAIAEKEEGNQ